ncbi:MAG TPA: hypothetical protein VHB97_09850 [Polyangia bacterium]|jgi:hypothetical protein|nr:hypothetical protein [Polyangia bacterium]
MSTAKENGNGFDRVDVKTADGAWQRMTRVEFEKLPLDRRVKAILGKQLRFFRGDQEITLREALD